MENERDEAKLTREHALAMKELEIKLMHEKYTAEVELKRLEAKWSSWLKIPITIVKLPIFMLFAIAYCIAVIRRVDPPKNYWNYLK